MYTQVGTWCNFIITLSPTGEPLENRNKYGEIVCKEYR